MPHKNYSHNPTVLITDGDQRASLAAVRALALAGYPVHVVSDRVKCLAGSSKYALTSTLLPNPLGNPIQFAEQLSQLANTLSAQVILPISEPSLLAVLSSPDLFQGLTVPFPDLETFSAISDKLSLLETAKEIGIKTPAQLTLLSPLEPDAAGFEMDRLDYPIVVKPARTIASQSDPSKASAEGAVTSPATAPDSEVREKFTVQHAANPAELRNVLRDFDGKGYPLLLQQRIVGPGVGIFVLLWNGELIASFSHRRIREHPPAGGVSVYREAYPMDPELLDKSVQLLKRWNWNGVAMIEYKIDETTGDAYLMEINGRFWGSLQLAVDAGVNFPALLLRCATGDQVEKVNSYNTNIRSRWEWGDINHLYMRMRYSDKDLAVPAGFPGKWRSLINFLKIENNSKSEVLRPSDLRPFIVESVDWFKELRK